MPLWGSAIYSLLSGHWLNECCLVLLLCTQGTYHYVVERAWHAWNRGAGPRASLAQHARVFIWVTQIEGAGNQIKISDTN
jgi:hypothetical protein